MIAANTTNEIAGQHLCSNDEATADASSITNRARASRKEARRSRADRQLPLAVTFRAEVDIRDARRHDDDPCSNDYHLKPFDFWYSEEEERTMVFEIMNLVSALRMGMANALPDSALDNADDDGGTNGVCTRGIEHLIDEKGRIRLTRRRRDVIDAVLAEQRTQRHRLLLKANAAEAWDSIARVASSHTAVSRIEAQQMGDRDEAAVFGRPPRSQALVVPPAGMTTKRTNNSSCDGELLREFRHSSAAANKDGSRKQQKPPTRSPSSRMSFWSRARKSFYRSLKDEEEMTPAVRSAHSRITLEKGGGGVQRRTTATKKEQGLSHHRCPSSQQSSSRHGKTAGAASAHTRIMLEETLAVSGAPEASAEGGRGRGVYGAASVASSAHARIRLERDTEDNRTTRNYPQNQGLFGGPDESSSIGGGSHFFLKKSLGADRSSTTKKGSGKECRGGKSGGGSSTHFRVMPAMTTAPDFSS